MIDETGKMIKKGLNKETASIGTPISKLNSGSKFMAQMSNIGDGLKQTCGGGQGLKCIK